MPLISFDPFSVEAPPEWADITCDVNDRQGPHTLAKQNGVGALQFSFARYKSGVIPAATPDVLQRMVEEFARSHGLAEPVSVVVESGPPTLAAASFSLGDDSLRVWQVSDGYSFAFATYTCAAAVAGMELADCELIVRSITFPPPEPR